LSAKKFHRYSFVLNTGWGKLPQEIEGTHHEIRGSWIHIFIGNTEVACIKIKDSMVENWAIK